MSNASSVLYDILHRYRFSRVNIKINVFDDIACTCSMQSFIAVIQIIPNAVFIINCLPLSCFARFIVRRRIS